MIPKFKNYFYPFLASISDGNTHRMKEIKSSMSQILNLSPEDIREVTKGGRNKHGDRVKWVATYLKRVELIVSPQKGEYIITENGKNILKKYGNKFSLDVVRDMNGYKESSRTANPSNSHWVEGHFRYDGTYVAGYYSNFKAQGLRRTRVTLDIEEEQS